MIDMQMNMWGGVGGEETLGFSVMFSDNMSLPVFGGISGT